MRFFYQEYDGGDSSERGCGREEVYLILCVQRRADNEVHLPSVGQPDMCYTAG